MPFFSLLCQGETSPPWLFPPSPRPRAMRKLTLTQGLWPGLHLIKQTKHDFLEHFFLSTIIQQLPLLSLEACDCKEKLSLESHLVNSLWGALLHAQSFYELYTNGLNLEATQGTFVTSKERPPATLVSQWDRAEMFQSRRRRCSVEAANADAGLDGAAVTDHRRENQLWKAGHVSPTDIHHSDDQPRAPSPLLAASSCSLCLTSSALAAGEGRARERRAATAGPGAPRRGWAKGSTVTQPGFEPWSYHWLAAGLWVIYSISLSLSFLICQIAPTTFPITVLWEANRVIRCRALARLADGNSGDSPPPCSSWCPKSRVLLRPKRLLHLVLKYLLLCHAFCKASQVFSEERYMF